jgi:hypothetical protein
MFIIWIKNEVRVFDTKRMVKEFIKANNYIDEKYEIFQYINKNKIRKL